MPTYRPGAIRSMQRGRVLVIHRTLPPILARTVDVTQRPDWATIRTDIQAIRAGSVTGHPDRLRAHITPPDPRSHTRAGDPLVTSTHDSDVDRQITALTEIIGALATTIAQLDDRVKHLDKTTRSRGHDDTDDGHEPAAWVWFSPPAAAEDDSEAADPRITADNFVTW